MIQQPPDPVLLGGFLPDDRQNLGFGNVVGACLPFVLGPAGFQIIGVHVGTGLLIWF